MPRDRALTEQMDEHDALLDEGVVPGRSRDLDSAADVVQTFAARAERPTFLDESLSPAGRVVTPH